MDKEFILTFATILAPLIALAVSDMVVRRARRTRLAEAKAISDMLAVLSKRHPQWDALEAKRDALLRVYARRRFTLPLLGGWHPLFLIASGVGVIVYVLGMLPYGVSAAMGENVWVRISVGVILGGGAIMILVSLGWIGRAWIVERRERRQLHDGGGE